jgi:hypothetical protein
MSTKHHDLAVEFPEQSEKVRIVSGTSFEGQKKKCVQLNNLLYSMIVA